MKRVTLLLLATGLLIAGSAWAHVPSLMRQASAPFWVSLSFGSATGLRSAELETYLFGFSGSVDHAAPDQFKITQSLGYHWSGSGVGPAVALDLQESFGDGAIGFAIVPRILWDFPLFPGTGITLCPWAGLGYFHLAPDCQDCTANGFTAQLAIDAKVILDDRLLIFFRPVAFDFQPVHYAAGQVSDWGTFIRYELAFGGGLIF